MVYKWSIVFEKRICYSVLILLLHIKFLLNKPLFYTVTINSGPVSRRAPFMGEEKPDEELMGNVSLLRGCLRHFRMSMI